PAPEVIGPEDRDRPAAGPGRAVPRAVEVEPPSMAQDEWLGHVRERGEVHGERHCDPGIHVVRFLVGADGAGAPASPGMEGSFPPGAPAARPRSLGRAGLGEVWIILGHEPDSGFRNYSGFGGTVAAGFSVAGAAPPGGRPSRPS